MRKKERTAFGQRLQEARTRKDLSQPQLAKLAGLAQATIGEAETTAIGSKHTAKLAAVLGVRAEWLASGEGEMIDGTAWPFAKVGLQRILALTPEDRAYVEAKMETALEHCEDLSLGKSPKGESAKTPIQIKHIPNSQAYAGWSADELVRELLRLTGDEGTGNAEGISNPARRSSRPRGGKGS